MGKKYLETVRNSARQAPTLEKLNNIYALAKEAGYGDAVKDVVAERAKALNVKKPEKPE